MRVPENSPFLSGACSLEQPIIIGEEPPAQPEKAPRQILDVEITYHQLVKDSVQNWTLSYTTHPRTAEDNDISLPITWMSKIHDSESQDTFVAAQCNKCSRPMLVETCHVKLHESNDQSKSSDNCPKWHLHVPSKICLTAWSDANAPSKTTEATHICPIKTSIQCPMSNIPNCHKQIASRHEKTECWM